jgi:glycosyltransferase involved in cell wall biosynthesis
MKPEHASLKILSVYGVFLNKESGTPLRIRNIVSHLAKISGVEMSSATRDESISFPMPHLRLSGYRRDILKVVRYVRQRRFDVVLVHTHASKRFLLPLRLFTSAKVVFEMHGFSEEQKKFYGAISLPRFWLMKALHALLYRSAHLMTTCSETARKIILKYNKHAVTILGGVDTKIFHPEVTPGDYIQKHHGEIVIGYAGNAMPWQGVDFLIEAFRELAAAHPEFRLALLLSGEHAYKEESGITIVGQLPHDEVPRFTAACDILVIPRPRTKHTALAFPSKLMEDMAMGKPVVASNTSDVDTVIRNGENGFLFPSMDKGALKEHLLALRDPRLRERIGKAARKTASGYSWPCQVERIYDKLCEIIV